MPAGHIVVAQFASSNFLDFTVEPLGLTVDLLRRRQWLLSPRYGLNRVAEVVEAIVSPFPFSLADAPCPLVRVAQFVRPSEVDCLIPQHESELSEIHIAPENGRCRRPPIVFPPPIDMRGELRQVRLTAISNVNRLSFGAVTGIRR
jgi:hypothetical protein